MKKTQYARPCVKWAGGKSKMLPIYAPLIPPTFGRYFEPCLGGGAMFFDLWNEGRIEHGVTLSDVNVELVVTYIAIRDAVSAVIEILREHAARHAEAEAARRAGKPKTEHYYYKVRSWKHRPSPGAWSDAERGARVLYMNRVCFNGLWREGPRGFNVPLGDYKAPVVCDEPNLRACSAALQGVEVRHEDFAAVVGRAQPGDLVYFDPPYVPQSETANFTGYTADGFGEHDHARMATVAETLKSRGVFVLISNSDAPLVRQLYGGGVFELMPVMAPRSMAARGASRGAIQELVIR